MRSCCCCCPCPAALGIGIGPRLRSFLRDYDALQSLALALIYRIGASPGTRSLVCFWFREWRGEGKEKEERTERRESLSACGFVAPACCGVRASWQREFVFVVGARGVWIVLANWGVWFNEIGCALIGSLGALFNGVLVINLVIGLFAVVAIESSSQTLGRTYAVLLFFAIVLDVAWFILFSHAIWNITPEEKYGQLFVLSLKLALWMQIIGFSMYRLGVSSSTPTYHEVNYDGRNSFLSPRSSSVRRNSMADDILGGSIYDPAYYSSLFEDVRNNTCTHQGDKQSGSNDSGSTSAGQSPRLKSFASRSFVANDVEAGLRRPLNS
uniref:Uncharacterized protein n=1 Tax=Oryza glumipatula TaxID=40148 RepID=A0A0E0AHD7_9ORYZ